MAREWSSVPVRPDRIFTTVVVAALVALASLTGAVAAAEPAPNAQTAENARTTQVQQEADEGEINLSDMEVENLSTSMTLESATIRVETEDGTQEVTVDSASVELTNATVEVRDATLADGMVDLDSAMLVVTEGTIEVDSSEGSRAIDLSETNQTVEDRTVVLTDLASETLGLSGDLGDATITELTVDGVSGTTSHETLVANFRATSATDDRNVSVGMENADVSVEGGSMTLTNATVEDGTFQAEAVNLSVDTATLEADRVVLLNGMELTVRRDVSVTVEDRTINETDVEVPVDDLSDLLERLTGSEAAASEA